MADSGRMPMINLILVVITMIIAIVALVFSCLGYFVASPDSIMVIGSISGPILSNTTSYVDIFTGATSTSGNPGGGLTLPNNFNANGTLALVLSGLIGPSATVGETLQISIQVGSAGSVANVLDCTVTASGSASAGSGFLSNNLLSSNNGTSTFCATDAHPYAGTTGIYTITRLTSCAAGSKLNCFLSPTTTAGDVQVIMAFLRYFPPKN